MVISRSTKPAATQVKRIFLVDDHPLIQSGLEVVLATDPSLAICGSASGPSEAFAKLPTAKADLVISDLNFGSVLEGLEFIRALRQRFPEIRILVNTMHEEELYGERALRAGTDGFLSKALGGDVLLKAIHSVLAGELVVSPTIQRTMMEAYLSGNRTDPGQTLVSRLSDRELEVFRMMGKGCSGRQISAELGISKSTVESHRANIKEKLGLGSPSELMRAAVAWVLEHDGGARHI